MGQFVYDFYFMGKFVKRFNSYDKAKKLVTWNTNLTHPKNLWEIKTVYVEQKKGSNNVVV